MLHSDNWQDSLYSPFFAMSTIGTPAFRQKAEGEVKGLLSLLNLEPGARLLDVPCGIGRHAIFLAAKGYQITGVDISRACLKIARKEHRHRLIRYLEGNMADLDSFRGGFDAVLNLFSSFGYFSTDRKNEMVLKEMIRCLKPGGKLVINSISRDFLMKIYSPGRAFSDGDISTLEVSNYDRKSKYNDAQIAIVNKKTGEGYHAHFRIRLYSKPEMESLFRKHGLKKVKTYGDFTGKPYERGVSTHPVYIGEKP